ncbi:hypothetical protein RHMOL_Rhmol09G0067200 [Rhododendron molle]|uniref:Uncharacterized protein n=1 Tax=Rhododendron molle TaxID=49168 RepID=A0ACC0MBP5_RHOML|nr:hypothetical protein RHMOL_Rhmol09G0067200 [Rhododendron molle]
MSTFPFPAASAGPRQSSPSLDHLAQPSDYGRLASAPSLKTDRRRPPTSQICLLRRSFWYPSLQFSTVSNAVSKLQCFGVIDVSCLFVVGICSSVQFLLDQNASGEDSDNIDWDTEDELEIQSSALPSSSRLTYPDGEATVGDAEAITTTDLSHSKLIHHFVGMGFPEELVAKAIEENGSYDCYWEARPDGFYLSKDNSTWKKFNTWT